MISRVGMAIVVSTLASGFLVSCGESSPTAPTAVAAVSTTPPTTNEIPVVFTELATGFSTSDLRDVDEQIIQVTRDGALVWTADGTRLSGYHVNRHLIDGVAIYWIGGAVCQEGCALEVRFGMKDGERRAYLTADYGHYNPVTLVYVEVSGVALVLNRTPIFPPGAPSLSGVVSETTPGGIKPVE